jgi:hypothetical protein
LSRLVDETTNCRFGTFVSDCDSQKKQFNVRCILKCLLCPEDTNVSQNMYLWFIGRRSDNVSLELHSQKGKLLPLFEPTVFPTP